jgi:hypothetical protein
MSRYLISHPVLNKESYIDTDSVQAIYFSLDNQITIINDTPDNIIDKYFPGDNTIYMLRLNPYAHYIISLASSLDEKLINHNATKLYRIHSSSYNTIVYGDCILFGSVDLLTYSSVDIHYSVPYEFIEQSYRIFKQ